MANDKQTAKPLQVKKLAPKTASVKSSKVEKKSTQSKAVTDTIVAVNRHSIAAITPSDPQIKTVNTGKAKKNSSRPAASSSDQELKAVLKPAVPKRNLIQQNSDKVALNITFQIKFRTQFGQNLYISGNHPLLGNGIAEQAVPLKYLNEELWALTLTFPEESRIDTTVTYNYILRNADGSVSYDWGSDKFFNPASIQSKDLLMLDAWNYAGYFENAFYSEPFKNVLLKQVLTDSLPKIGESFTHTFKVKAPLLTKSQVLFISGSAKALNEWNRDQVILMHCTEGEDFYQVSLNLEKEFFPLAYKYGVYDLEKNRIVRFENGNNRLIYDFVAPGKTTIVNDGFAQLPNTTWKGTGVAIPVFSLRSEKSFGVGEFSDIALLVDWAKRTGLKLVQILPINDTTATHTWTDSYPYAAISAFALHPIYINLAQVAGDKYASLLTKLETERERLNGLDALDYETVLKIKYDVIRKIYESEKATVFNSSSFKSFFETNQHWLLPYAVFCYLRDTYHTSDFNKWATLSTYDADAVSALSTPGTAEYDAIALNYFIQYHLHLQLKAATEYAHQNGIIVKGDIAIGIYRYGADAWQQPELFNMNLQAGAPPDDFAIKGQNWGFPTYNWQRMREDGFAWWKNRFEQMGYYFDAFRIDHILGFFRIWSIPMHAVEGILGYFVPAIPIHINELNSRNIGFNYHRYTQPFINDHILWELFGHNQEFIKSNFLEPDGFGNYNFKNGLKTQRESEAYLDNLEDQEFAATIKQGVFDLISNVILFEAEGSQGQQYHFRFAMNSTSSFRYLDGNVQKQLNELYVNYFFRRQDDFWMKEALQKLPALKRVTNMLICGEDLGLVPACVPDVMKQLGLLSLEIQRMPKDPKKKFFHPNDAPYLSVITPSTHDMSTIRGWWEEDKQAIQQFYNHELGQTGNAPFYCEAWINKSIVVQHLYSPAMWSIFQLQDILGIDAQLRRINPEDERINIPANPKHYWRYRMHFTLEKLLQEDDFNNELLGYVQASGRG